MNTTTNTALLSISLTDLDGVTGGVNWSEVGRRAVSWGGVGATGGAVVGGVAGGVAGATAGGVGAVPGAVAGARVGSTIGRIGGAIAGAGSAVYDTWNQ
ncbi:hypothetical protein BH11MYX3_BH11MYX3_46760 [soil metagenome]